MRRVNDEIAHFLELGPPTVKQQEGINAAVEAGRLAYDKLNQDNAIEEHANAVREAMEAERREVDETNRAWDGFANAIGDAFTRGGNILHNLGNSLLDWLKNLVAQMIATWVKTRIIGSFLGGPR
jgi:hypothetical protein